jgi:DNA-directed RNA polymerase specialized sigma24 family protein
MSESAETPLEQRIRELSERYAFHLERWTHSRTPVWARGMFDPREVVQDTLVEMARRLDDLPPDCDPAFLGRVRQALYDQVRARVRQGRRAAQDATGRLPSSDDLPLHDSALGSALLERYEAGLQRLTPLDREAIIARAELGLPWSEVTELLHKTGVAAARMTVSRALVRLAREMSYER